MTRRGSSRLAAFARFDPESAVRARTVRLLLLALLLAGPARADTATADGSARSGDAFARANATAAAGRNAEAADAFAALARSEGSSPELLLNLGNASARAGRTGEAILAWERVLVLDPARPEATANLAALRRRASLPEVESDAWTRLVARFGADGWARIGSIAWIGGCLLLLLSAIAGEREGGRPLLRRLVRLGIPALLALVLLSVAAERRALADLERGVVLGDGGGLRAAPFASAPRGQAVVAGELVRPERAVEGWVLVTTAAGKSGWLEAARVGRIGELPGPSA